MNNKRNFIISIVLVLVAIVFTVLVQVIDVRPIGVNDSNIGFSRLNQLVFENVGTNMTWHDITNVLGILSFVIAFVYVVIGCIQLITRKSLFKVDKEIIALGIFYIIILATYILFEKVVINYRPILLDGTMEASYPSSHTLLAISICGSAILMNKKLFNNKITKIINILLIIFMLIIIIGRLLSGVHWCTDILGGVIIGSVLLMLFYSFLNMIKKDE